MLQINFPEHNFRIKKEKNKHIIFDEVRRRWVALTPEEWVRQNFLQYLIQVKNYPASLISVEKIIRVGDLSKRYDIVVYKEHTPWLIVECKESNTPVDIKVIEQVIRYNMALAISYFVITNGNESFCYEISRNSFRELAALPEL
ncbi:type I restriction enzyme HsdR N-terminal domain-containing protein [Parafilimonas terrae]|uniref:Type I restriction enzyme R protein N terminus (HSDR_N) n=1 Tax=Parafilimonas terrae TaxID=1465490 RepID=A0A1I5RKH6_9BACT|nr:type I restriction enzyme HsdR N-terminal domain-containing protein [Parafilimonas terrae]SFP58837.1 Type I restriction enzyme R protein N terminus (HSDR_N) [Parafilimonas terrae]